MDMGMLGFPGSDLPDAGFRPPPQEPGTWNLAGTCTLVNTPHITT